MTVLAFIEDMVLRRTMEAAAMPAGSTVIFAGGSDGLVPPPRKMSWDLVIVDLDLARTDPVALIEMVRATLPATPIIGFCSHVVAELQARAATAGCTSVLARSEFVDGLPDLLAGQR